MYESIERYIDSLLENSAPDRPIWNIEAVRQGKKMGWNYIDGCMLISLLRLHELTKNEKYFDFVKNFIDYYVTDGGKILGFKPEDYNLDNINEGRVLFDLYSATSDKKYLEAIETVYAQLKTQPKTANGSFWHKKIYHDQVWLDGLFMAQIFYYRYLTLKSMSIEPVLKQFRNVERLMKDKSSGLYYHGYDESKSMFWANKETGLSSNFWLRATGWYLAALADITAYLPLKSKEREEFKGYLKNALDSVYQHIDRDKHMFYQVVNKPEVKGNYLETSGSALIAYATMRSANEKLVSSDYFLRGKEVFDGICAEYLKENDGELSLSGICLVAGLGPESKTNRDGSIEYYLSEPIVSTDAKGVAPFIMAYVELKKSM